MDFHALIDWFTLDHIMHLIEQYKALGPLPGILLLIIEAFFPFIPLFLIVIANANAFGLWLGFFISWIGCSIGAILVFLVIRKFGRTKALAFLYKSRQVQKIMNWVERHGFGPIFLMICFPFTPSAVVNIVGGLSRISTLQYALAVLAGKMVMVFIVSYLGYDVFSLMKKPIKTAVVLVVVFVLWFVGKRIEQRLTKKLEKGKRQV
jgi:uncharacterized membrane protein YdjX (TVP38/TMEM64 family)